MTKYSLLFGCLVLAGAASSAQGQDLDDTHYASEGIWRIDRYDGICELTQSSDWESPLTITRNGWGAMGISLGLPESEIPATDSDRFAFEIGDASFAADNAMYGFASALDLFDEFETAFRGGTQISLTRNGEVRKIFSLAASDAIFAKLVTCAEGNYPTPPRVMKVN